MKKDGIGCSKLKVKLLNYPNDIIFQRLDEDVSFQGLGQFEYRRVVVRHAGTDCLVVLAADIMGAAVPDAEKRFHPGDVLVKRGKLKSGINVNNVNMG